MSGRQWRHECGILTEEMVAKAIPIQCPVLSVENFKRYKVMLEENFMNDKEEISNTVIEWNWAEYMSKKGASNE